MSQPPSALGPITGTPRAAPPEVQAAIARAAQATGVDFQYLLAQARLESSLDPNARAGTSSAAGLYQFTKGTWLQTLDQHGAEYGLGWASEAISGGRVSDPGLRQQLLAMRYDPQVSALMAAELASDNADALSAQLGRAPDAAELYLAHFLGAGGAGKFLAALQADPNQSAAALLPAAAVANRGIFYRDGVPRSVGEVMELLRGKVARAMGDATSPSPLGRSEARDSERGLGWGLSPIATSDRRDMPHPLTPSPKGEWEQRRPSMAETLRATFNAADTAAPAQVRIAYAKLRAFNL